MRASSSSRSAVLAIGCAAGFGGDRTDAAAPILDTLIARGGPGALIFETLAERTLALAHLERLKDPERGGYAPSMEAMAGPAVLRRCVENGIPMIGNFGAANPRAAAMRIRAMAAEAGLAGVRVAIVEGDDLSDPAGLALVRRHLGTEAGSARDIICANVYQGAGAIAEALRAGAQVVVTGRVADPALTLGPAWAHFGWDGEAWDVLARATMAGHLLECGAQVTGGYFADPGCKDVPGLAEVGFPIAEIGEDGSFVVTKPEHTGGVVDTRTVKEQLLYELHNPAAYLTPDVVADISEAEVEQVGPNRVAVSGVRGHPKPPTLKALAWYSAGWLGEGEISYAGPNAEARARLAAEVLRKRLDDSTARLRFDLIGVTSVFGNDRGETAASSSPESGGGARDVRLRAAASDARREQAERLTREVLALYTCGPAGGGGVRTSITPRLSSASCLVPRELAPAKFSMLE